MDNQNMTYPELRDLFVEHNKTQLAKPVSACIVYSQHHIHHSLGWKTAHSGSQRPPCKPGLLLYRKRPLPPLQERKDGLDCRVS